MPAINLRNVSPQPRCESNPLPSVLHTPAGLAIIEIQGTIHAPLPTSNDVDDTSDSTSTTQSSVGRLEFPLYDTQSDADKDTRWMKKVYLYIGKFQRLTGEVKKLNKPYLVIGKAGYLDGDEVVTTEVQSTSAEDLEILVVVKYKILFASRPEPVGE